MDNGNNLNDAALELRFDSDAGNGLSVRGYLCALLERLWVEGDGFSGKRPFGNSGWEYEIYTPLIRAGIIPGKLDEDGYIDEVDNAQAHAFVRKLIRHVFSLEPTHDR